MTTNPEAQADHCTLRALAAVADGGGGPPVPGPSPVGDPPSGEGVDGVDGETEEVGEEAAVVQGRDHAPEADGPVATVESGRVAGHSPPPPRPSPPGELAEAAAEADPAIGGAPAPEGRVVGAGADDPVPPPAEHLTVPPGVDDAPGTLGVVLEGDAPNAGGDRDGGGPPLSDDDGGPSLLLRGGPVASRGVVEVQVLGDGPVYPAQGEVAMEGVLREVDGRELRAGEGAESDRGGGEGAGRRVAGPGATGDV